MSLISRTYTFTDGTTAYGSQVDSEIANIVNTINSLDSAGTTWTNVKVTTLLPQANINMNALQLTNLAVPSSAGNAARYPITAAQITAGVITNNELAAGAAFANLGASGVSQIVTNSTDSGISSISVNDALIISKAITTTGGSVLVLARNSHLKASGSPSYASMFVVRGSTAIPGNYHVYNPYSNTAVAGAVMCVDTPPAGTYTYNFYYNNGGFGVSAGESSLVLIELKR